MRQHKMIHHLKKQTFHLKAGNLCLSIKFPQWKCKKCTGIVCDAVSEIWRSNHVAVNTLKQPLQPVSCRRWCKTCEPAACCRKRIMLQKTAKLTQPLPERDSQHVLPPLCHWEHFPTATVMIFLTDVNQLSAQWEWHIFRMSATTWRLMTFHRINVQTFPKNPTEPRGQETAEQRILINVLTVCERQRRVKEENQQHDVQTLHYKYKYCIFTVISKKSEEVWTKLSKSAAVFSAKCSKNCGWHPQIVQTGASI